MIHTIKPIQNQNGIKLFRNVHRNILRPVNQLTTVPTGFGQGALPDPNFAQPTQTPQQIIQEYLEAQALAKLGKSLIQFDLATDVVQNQTKIITKGIWTGDIPTLTTYATSSFQTADQKRYYYAVYNTSSLLTGSAVQFSVAYGNRLGSGSVSTGVTDAPTLAVYSQFKQLLLNTSDDIFTFNSASTSQNSDDIYVVTLNRARIKDSLDPGNWQLNLATLSGSAVANNVHTGSNVQVKGDNSFIQLIDNSQIGTGSVDITNAGPRYNIISGSILSGVSNAYTSSGNYVHYGFVYPQLGILVLNGKALNDYVDFNTVSGSDVPGDNAFKLFTSISGAAAIDPIYGFTARNNQKLISSHYFVRVKNGDLNYSNNPSFAASTDGTIRNVSFVDDPQVYITTVGLYNSNNELLAVAKLSRPLVKNFETEVLLRVRLDY
jgi:hypothetical protein